MNYYGSMKNPESLITREFLSQIVGTTTYDPSVTYNNGDFCFYDTTGKTYIDSLWRCAADGVTGAWDATKWEELDILSLFPHSLHIDLNELVDTATIAKIQANTEGMCYVTFDNKVVDAFNLVPTYKVDTATYYKTAANYFVTCEPGTTPVINYTDPAMYEPENTGDLLTHCELLLQAREFWYGEQVYNVIGNTAKMYAYHTHPTVTTDYVIDFDNNVVTEINVDDTPYMYNTFSFFKDISTEGVYTEDEHKEFAAKVAEIHPPVLVAKKGNLITKFYWASADPYLLTAQDDTYTDGDVIFKFDPATGITTEYASTAPALLATDYMNDSEPEQHEVANTVPTYVADGILGFKDKFNNVPVYSGINMKAKSLIIKNEGLEALTITMPCQVLWSKDGMHWSNVATIPTIIAGAKMYVRLAEPVHHANFGTIGLSTRAAISGDLSALIDFDAEGTAQELFANQPVIAYTATLPAPKTAGQYKQMFSGATQLTQFGTAFSRILTASCYEEMFSGAGLRTIPELPATEIPTDAYKNMFAGISGIKFDDTGDKVFMIHPDATVTCGMFTGVAVETGSTAPDPDVEPWKEYKYKEV